jgi:geranylgeranyl pyrophosphate synthase
MSIEMFHKASLVHDDIEDDDGYPLWLNLPCIAVIGLPTAINVGDYLIGLGYRISEPSCSPILGPDGTAVDILDCLSERPYALG